MDATVHRVAAKDLLKSKNGFPTRVKDNIDGLVNPALAGLRFVVILIYIRPIGMMESSADDDLIDPKCSV